MTKPRLDEFDLRILRELQQESNLSVAELGARIGLSHTPCWRRIKRLEEAGIISKKLILISREALQLNVTVYAYLRIKMHDEDSLNAFERAVHQVDEVVECYSTSGDTDYVLKVIVGSVEHYEQLLKQTLVHLPNVAAINSSFALKEVKYTTRLPI